MKLTMLNVFLTKETPSAIEKHREFNEPENRQNSQNPLSTTGQSTSELHESLTAVFA